MYIIQIAAAVGLDKKSDVLLAFCQRMEEEYIVATWQLSVLDSYQWHQLGAPIGLAAAVRYHTTTATIPVSATTTTMNITPFATPEKPVPLAIPLSPTLETASSKWSLKQPNFEESATTATATATIARQIDKVEDENLLAEPLSQSFLQVSLASDHDNSHHQIAAAEKSHVNQLTIDSIPLASSSDILDKQQDESCSDDGKHPDVDVVEPFEPINPEVFTDCLNLQQVDTTSDSTALSETIVDEEHDQDDGDENTSNDQIAVPKLDIDTVLVEDSPNCSSDYDDTTPSIPLTASSDDDEENDDPDEVAELVGSLEKKENRLWLDRDVRENDDDATVVVSNVSPERKNAVKEELDKKNTASGKSAQDCTA
jgi:hypothetical protein